MAAGEIITLSGLADEVIRVDRVELRDGPKWRAITRIFRFVRDIRLRDIDLVIDLHSLSETNLLAFLSRAKYRLLANRESRSLDSLSNFRPRPPKEDKSKHLGDRYLDVLLPLGIDDADRSFIFQPLPDMIGDRFVRDLSAPVIGLFPGAGHPSRCWPLKSFADLAAKLSDNGFKIAVFLGPEERDMKEQVNVTFPPGTTIIDELSLSQFIAAAARLDAFVTNDTGPMHLAACAGSPIVLLLDERAPTTYLPMTDKLKVINDKSIKNIDVDHVSTAVKDLISRFRTTGK